MSLRTYLSCVWWKYRIRAPRRYRNLLQEIRRHQPRSILEIGVYSGSRAEEMLAAATLNHAPSAIRYYGFDLFEELSEELMKKEFSKQPHSIDRVRSRLEKTGAKINLYQGFTQSSLPEFLENHDTVADPIDFIFIDGGHAEDTIASDWQAVKQLMHPGTIVIFDDYYVTNDEHMEGLGCQSVIDKLPRDRYDVRLMDPVDRFQKDWGTLPIRFARVQLRP